MSKNTKRAPKSKSAPKSAPTQAPVVSDDAPITKEALAAQLDAPAPVEVQAPPAIIVAPVVSAESVSARALKMLISSQGATHDVLKGRIGARTHAIHVALVEAYCEGRTLSTKQIVERASSLLGAPCNATNSHLNTMQTARRFVARVNGAWALTESAVKLLIV